MDAVELLKEDHEKVKGLLKEWQELPSGQPEPRRRLAERIIREMMVHERIEEDLFYPAYKKAADDEGKELVAESKEEHHVVDLLIDELQSLDVDDPEFDAKMKVMKENIEHHIQEEEKEMFPDARELLGDRLGTLGQEMRELKESLLREMRERPAQERRAR